MSAVGLLGALGWLLIGTELAIAGALLSARSRVVGAVGAVVLLAMLTAVVVNLARGRTPACHCFGRLSRDAIDWSTVARNGLLASLAGYVAARGQGGVAFAALAVVFGGTWLGLGPLRRRIRSASAAPAFELADESGRGWTLERLLSPARPVLLVFSQPACGACLALAPDLDEWHARLGGSLSVAVISEGSGAPRGVATGQRPGYPILPDPEGSLASSYGVVATPSAILIERDGRRASVLVRGGDEIRELVQSRFAADDPSRFPRRVAIARAARGAAMLGAFPLVAAACGSSKSSSSTTTSSTSTAATTSAQPKALRVGNSYICQQTYALCTDAPCVRSTHNPDIAICDCVVKHGYSIGLTPCAQKAPHGTTVYSTFSTELVTSTTRAMACPANAPWANCVDSICELDPKDPSKAVCQCQLVKTGPSFTFGGDCKTHTCSTTIWSGAHNGLGGGQVAAAMRRLGQPLKLPPPCPKS